MDYFLQICHSCGVLRFYKKALFQLCKPLAIRCVNLTISRTVVLLPLQLVWNLMRNPFFYILLLVLVVLDGWLLSHPNLVGRAGVFFFDYNYLNTFPKALGTVIAVTSIALLTGWLIGRLSRVLAGFLLGALMAMSVYWLIDSFTLYNSGIYKLTGAGFRAGAILLPGLLALIFGKNLTELLTIKPVHP